MQPSSPGSGAQICVNHRLANALSDVDHYIDMPYEKNTYYDTCVSVPILLEPS